MPQWSQFHKAFDQNSNKKPKFNSQNLTISSAMGTIVNRETAHQSILNIKELISNKREKVVASRQCQINNEKIISPPTQKEEDFFALKKYLNHKHTKYPRYLQRKFDKKGRLAQKSIESSSINRNCNCQTYKSLTRQIDASHMSSIIKSQMHSPKDQPVFHSTMRRSVVLTSARRTIQNVQMNQPIESHQQMFSPNTLTTGNKPLVNDHKDLVHVIRRSQALNQFSMIKNPNGEIRPPSYSNLLKDVRQKDVAKLKQRIKNQRKSQTAVPTELQTLQNSIFEEEPSNYNTEKVFVYSGPNPGIVRSPVSSTMTYSTFIKNDPSREQTFLNLRQITHELSDAYLI